MTRMSTPKMPTLGRRPRLVDDIVLTLREMIISEALRPGTQLLQIELAERLGVSRTPLRESFRILEHEGLIRTANNNRTVEVVPITSEDLRQMYQVREVIDGLAARLITKMVPSTELLDQLRDKVRVMKEARHPYNPAQRVQAHTEFHTLIAEHAGNPKLLTYLPMIRTSSASLYLPFINNPEATKLVDNGKLVSHEELFDRTDRDHLAIVEAIKSGNARSAEAVARRHIRVTLRNIGQLDEWKAAIAEADGAM
jgi:GntR family transcriptional regulator, vanillate catabolism transcriptional regulator